MSYNKLFYLSFNLVGDEDDIRSERFKWSRACTFSYNTNDIGLAVAYALAICTHLSVHGTTHPMSAASVRPRLIVSSAALVTSLILVNKETLVQARLSPAILSVASLSMALVQVQSGGVAILRCPLAGLLALFPALLSLLLSLCHRIAVSTC